MSEEKTNSLVKQLKEMVFEVKQREAARKIERASSTLLGDFHFVYGQEAIKLATVPMADLKKFIDEVETIRAELDFAYDEALEKLGEEK